MSFVTNFIRFPAVRNCENQLRFDKVTDSLQLGTYFRHSVNTAYCYRLGSMVCPSVSVVKVIPAKMAEPIEMLFGLRTLVGPRNHALDGATNSPWKGQL